jgi:hypothetical protein
MSDFHKNRHVELHRALDELVTDYINHKRNRSVFTAAPQYDGIGKTTVMQLIKWSKKQAAEPTEPEN